ncbi:hypothetical protein GCM10025876_18870 [Demequina litorisediminis]|uniref:FHA domain-containing protein n=1 Tax=Demequina litorisediminis TaxID=1849022 RepID=A0ABQ6IEY8_9MICO|nr:hypothetical protein [Demequina litorisediminis]GMA35683.1 hypothetical protein GCM10025876_18870 [Demequina litorisediminis]
MSEISITLLRFGFLILLWALVLAAIGVLRADLYGTRVTSRGRGRNARPKPDARTNKVAAPSRAGTGVRAGAVSATKRLRGSPRRHVRPPQGHRDPVGFGAHPHRPFTHLHPRHR